MEKSHPDVDRCPRRMKDKSGLFYAGFGLGEGSQIQKMKDSFFTGSNHWEVKDVKIVSNPKLFKQYTEAQKEINESTETKRTPSASGLYLYLACRTEEEAVRICREGVPTGLPGLAALGKISMGVHLFKHADLCLESSESPPGKQVILVVFKAYIRKSKSLDAKLYMNNGDPPEPTPGFQAHQSTIPPRDGDSLSLAIRKSMVYIYEYDEEGLPRQFPRHCFPIAKITLKNMKPARTPSCNNRKAGALARICGNRTSGKVGVLGHKQTPGKVGLLGDKTPGTNVALKQEERQEEPLREICLSVKEDSTKALMSMATEIVQRYKNDFNSMGDQPKSISGQGMKIGVQKFKFNVGHVSSSVTGESVNVFIPMENVPSSLWPSLFQCFAQVQQRNAPQGQDTISRGHLSHNVPGFQSPVPRSVQYQVPSRPTPLLSLPLQGTPQPQATPLLSQVAPGQQAGGPCRQIPLISGVRPIKQDPYLPVPQIPGDIYTSFSATPPAPHRSLSTACWQIKQEALTPIHTASRSIQPFLPAASISRRIQTSAIVPSTAPPQGPVLRRDYLPLENQSRVPLLVQSLSNLRPFDDMARVRRDRKRKAVDQEEPGSSLRMVDERGKNNEEDMSDLLPHRNPVKKPSGWGAHWDC